MSYKTFSAIPYTFPKKNMCETDNVSLFSNVQVCQLLIELKQHNKLQFRTLFLAPEYSQTIIVQYELKENINLRALLRWDLEAICGRQVFLCNAVGTFTKNISLLFDVFQYIGDYLFVEWNREHRWRCSTLSLELTQFNRRHMVKMFIFQGRVFVCFELFLQC